MKYLVLVLAAVGLVGCATPSQNAALVGAVIGAAVVNSVNNPPPPRVVHCHLRLIGYDVYRRPMYQQVCR